VNERATSDCKSAFLSAKISSVPRLKETIRDIQEIDVSGKTGTLSQIPSNIRRETWEVDVLQCMVILHDPVSMIGEARLVWQLLLT
jgi:hypothetical protein